MTRRLRRGGKPGFIASATNGRYYPGHAIPIARSDIDKAAMLAAHLAKGTMIEVLVSDRLPLTDDTVIACYSEQDAVTAEQTLARLGAQWEVALVDVPGPYPRNDHYCAAVHDFIERAITDVDWRGNGLEFDRV